MVRWIVSLESPPTPARAPLLGALAAGLGLQAAEPHDPEQGASAGPLDSLLTRMRGLARLPAGAHAVWSSSCLLDVPEDPVWRQLYHELSGELVSRLVPGGAPGTRHLMVCLDVDPDEAFESLFGGGGAGAGGLQGNGCPLARRESGLEDIAKCTERVDGGAPPSCGRGATPFQSQRVRLHCPRFVADNPVAMEALSAAAVRLCAAAMTC